MIGITHNQYLKLFSDIAIAHRDINSFYSGDLDNYTANQSEALNPVTLWVVVDDDVITGKTDKPKYNFIVLDWVNQDSSNLDEVYSDTLRISKDILALLRQPYYEDFFKVQEDVTFTPFNEKFDSDVAGWQFSLTFDQPFIYDSCEVNTTGLPTINYETIAINSSTYAWGSITGTLSNQTDLQTALNAKVPTSRTLTINGTTYDLSADRTWTISTFTTPILAIGTSNTAGVIGYDGTVFYKTTNTNNQGLSPAIHFIRADSAVNLLNQATIQPIFQSPTNGRITLPVGTYRFNALLRVTSMDTTSGNAAFTLAGTATLGTILFSNWGYDTAPTTGPGTFNGGFAITSATAASMQNASAANSMATNITGTFEVTVTGTVIPSITLVNAAAAVVTAGSYFECWSVGSTSVESVGAWS